MAGLLDLLAQYVPSYPQVQGALQSARESFVPERNVGNTVEAAMSMLPMGRLAPIRAYHGSPYNFNRFDMSKIGTGEGAQSYGHGLYFAEAEPVARSYRDSLSKEAPGHMYEVNINAHPEQFLDWEKSLAQQSEAVRSGVKNAMGIDYWGKFDPAKAERTYSEYQNAGGDSLVRRGLIASDDKLVADRLREAGIPGIKYLDQLSRGEGTPGGSSNYVLFNDSIIDIMRKYGMAGVIPFAGAAAPYFANQPAPIPQQQAPIL